MTLNENDREEIKQWLDTNNFCAMPFYHVAIESNGDIRPCCLGDPLKNPDGTKLNIIGKTVKQIIDHPTHQAFRQSFVENKQHPACHPCWGKFHNDRFSGRYVYSSTEKANREVQQIMRGKKPEQKLVWLEIKAGNRCNLSCRICGLWNSAKWLKETYDMKKIAHNGQYPDFKNSYELEYNTTSKWIDDVDFWKNIDGFDDIKVIHIMGGEPMMIEEHYEMLKAIDERFDASEIYIWYNTNGTIIPTDEEEKLLAKFKKVIWHVSLDDFNDKFDYQRKGANWEDAKKNIDYFFNKPNYTASIDATISIFNVLTFVDYVHELDSILLRNGNRVGANLDIHYVSTSGAMFNIRTLHPDIKAKVFAKLTEDKKIVKEHYKKYFDHIIDFMMKMDEWSEATDNKRRFEISTIDKFRNEKFSNVFPEMAKLLNYE